MLLDYPTRGALVRLGSWGRITQVVIGIKRGDVNTGLPSVRARFQAGETLSGLAYMMRWCDLAEASGRAGQIADGLAETEEAIERSERNEERWIIQSCCASRAICPCRA